MASIKEKMSNKVGRELEGQWKWNGIEFTRRVYVDTPNKHGAVAIFKSKFKSLTVRYETEIFYGIPDEEKTFTGTNAIMECIAWVVDRAYAIDDDVERRTAPHEQGHDSYLKALRGK